MKKLKNFNYLSLLITLTMLLGLTYLTSCSKEKSSNNKKKSFFSSSKSNWLEKDFFNTAPQDAFGFFAVDASSKAFQKVANSQGKVNNFVDTLLKNLQAQSPDQQNSLKLVSDFANVAKKYFLKEDGTFSDTLKGNLVSLSLIHI